MVIDGHPVAALMYTRDIGLPVAFCFARLGQEARELKVELRNGLQLASWSDSEFGYVVVGEMEPASAKQIARSVSLRL
jgi:anti-sigma factor RsiW